MDTITLPNIIRWLEAQPQEAAFEIGEPRFCPVARYVQAVHGAPRSFAYYWRSVVAGTDSTIEHDALVQQFVKLFDTLPGKVATRDQVLALAREIGTIELAPSRVRASLRLAGGEGRE